MAKIFSTYLNAQQNISGPETITVTTEGVIANAGGGGLYINSGAGNSTVTVDGIIDSEAFGIEFYSTPLSGASKVTVGANGQVNSAKGFSLDAAHAVDLTNSGIMQSAEGIRIFGNATSFTIVNSGLISSASGTAIQLQGTSTATHTITNNEIIEGNFDASTSEGADKLTSYGEIFGDVDLGNGANYFISKGYVDGNIKTGTGLDTFLNYNIVAGDVDLDAGNDVMTNNTTIKGAVTLGLGNDRFTNAGEVLTGVISMGEGDDIFVSGKYADKVMDEAGKDSYDMGDGLDIFDAILAGSNDTGSASKTLGKYDIDTVSGGAQTGADLKKGIDSVFGDIYDASEATKNIIMNLDSTTRYDVVNGAKSTDTKAAYTATSLEIGQDTVKGFEEIWLGGGDDLVFGTATADKISGKAGADTIYGGGSNDYLLGDAGNDKIVGEAGRDLLSGGADNDTFYYRAIADSTLALTGRDLILDFSDGDLIDLSAIAGMNLATLVINDNFVDTVPNATDKAEIRIVTTISGYTIQIDTTGDNKADMAIDVKIGGAFDGWQITDFDLVV